MPRSARKLTDFDRWQLHRLRALLEAESSKLSVDWLFVAELDAVKGYLKQIGLEHVIPVFEQAEYRRVAGAVLSEPGRANMPDECLACFAAVGMDSKRNETSKKKA
jgi:hypothetical protein